MAKVKIYRFEITLKPRSYPQQAPDGSPLINAVFHAVRSVEAMSYREQDEFICFDDTRVTVYQVRRELIDEISCNGTVVAEQEVDDLAAGGHNG